MRKTKTLILILIVLLAVSILHSRSERIRKAGEEQLLQDQKLRKIYLEKKAEWQMLSQELRSAIRAFKGTSGVFIKDLEYGFEFRHNEDLPFPSASLSKIPIMAAAYKASNEGMLELDQEIVLSQKDKLSGAGNLKNMDPGTIFTLEELISLMIKISDNTATNMVTSALGMGYINTTITGFGMDSSLLSRRIADYAARSKGLENYTTARDMAIILEDIYKGTLVNEDISKRSLGLLLDQKYGDRIPKHLPKEITVAHKTGLERGVCHDAGIVLDPKGPFLICVLTGHSNTTSVPSKKFIARVSFLTYNRHGSLAKETQKVRISGSNPTASEIQRFLKENDFYNGRVDGIIGPKTKSAIRAFQTFSGIAPDGIVGPDTAKAMSEYSTSG